MASTWPPPLPGTLLRFCHAGELRGSLIQGTPPLADTLNTRGDSGRERMTAESTVGSAFCWLAGSAVTALAIAEPGIAAVTARDAATASRRMAARELLLRLNKLIPPLESRIFALCAAIDRSRLYARHQRHSGR